jgi:hypothetical protein
LALKFFQKFMIGGETVLRAERARACRD